MKEPDAKSPDLMEACEFVREQLALLVYGELSFDEEERVETHLYSCADCRVALEQQKELHIALDRMEIEPAPSLLRECRAALGDRLAAEGVHPSQVHEGWWDKLVDFVTGAHSGAWLRPAGALTLIAIGFVGARFTPLLSSGSGVGTMGLTDGSSAHVRNVETGANGQVQIILDETRQKVISGGLDDRQIRAMLLNAARESADPGVRAETVEFLTSDAGAADVRDVLISALKNDQNAGVRLKAMEGLKRFGQDPKVRTALAGVLLSDSNPGVRTQAIDVLTQSIGPTVDRDIVGALQELMVKENNPYVRERCQSVLASWNASAEIY
jgi:HEAT repeats/Putative zinc-finger